MNTVVNVDADNQTAVSTIAPLQVQVVAVTFNNSADAKEYYYFAPLDARAGQYAAVYSQGPGEFPFKIVYIARDHVIDVEGKANKAIWGAFDESFAKKVQEQTEQLARVRSMLQQKKKAFEEKEVFNMMAQSDPEVAALLAQLGSFSLT